MIFIKPASRTLPGFTFTFVGNIDANAIKPLLEEYLGALPAMNNHETAKGPRYPYAGRKDRKTSLSKGTEPKSTVILVYSGKFDYSPENKIRLDALKEALQIRCCCNACAKMRVGCTVPAYLIILPNDPQSRYSFGIQFHCAPQNVDKLIVSALDEINKLRTDDTLTGKRGQMADRNKKIVLSRN